VSSLRVERPDGTVHELVPGTEGGTSVTFSATDLPGVYTVTPILGAESSSPPAATTGTSAEPSSPAASGEPPVDPATVSKFVVALFDVRESTITPGGAAGLEALGPDASAEPGSSPATGAGATDRPTTRDELWGPLILLILVVLCVEWAAYHRDALARIRRGLGLRLGRRPADGRT
jgi:hypothetical protein